MKTTAKRVLICGVSGQDGGYLASHLLSKGYEVWGSSRDAEGNPFTRLQTLGIKDKVRKLSVVPEDFRSVFRAFQICEPHEVYFLAGQSSVGLSFEQPAETIQSITLGTLNFLEALRMSNTDIRMYHAGSSECFGDTNGQAANEHTPFDPRSPYAVAKASAYWLVNNYREAYGLFVCTGILFNHESPLRPARFVTAKIVNAVNRIASGQNEVLTLGRLDISRDWGWAPEYVDAMWRMLQQDEPGDFVIGTGTAHSLEDFVRIAFEHAGLNWKHHVVQSQDLMRPTELKLSVADASKAHRTLGWRASYHMPDVVKAMLDAKSSG